MGLTMSPSSRSILEKAAIFSRYTAGSVMMISPAALAALAYMTGFRHLL